MERSIAAGIVCGLLLAARGPRREQEDRHRPIPLLVGLTVAVLTGLFLLIGAATSGSGYPWLVALAAEVRAGTSLVPAFLAGCVLLGALSSSPLLRAGRWRQVALGALGAALVSRRRDRRHPACTGGGPGLHGADQAAG
jgi:hypothetical protein